MKEPPCWIPASDLKRMRARASRVAKRIAKRIAHAPPHEVKAISDLVFEAQWRAYEEGLAEGAAL